MITCTRIKGVEAVSYVGVVKEVEEVVVKDKEGKGNKVAATITHTGLPICRR